jgi:hypothetical protein
MAAQRPKYSYPGRVATARNTLPLSARTGRRAPTPWPAGRDLSAAANGRIYISFISFTLSREDGHIDMAALLTQQTRLAPSAANATEQPWSSCNSSRLAVALTMVASGSQG